MDWLLGLPRWLWRAIRRLRVVTLVAAVVAALVALALVSISGDERDDERGGSELVSRRGRPLDDAAEPESYRLVYRIENRGGGELVVRTEEVWVRRPFSGRVEDRPGERSGERPGERAAGATVTVTVFGSLSVASPASEPVALEVPPNPAAGDLHPAGALEAARRAGLVELRERRRIAAVDRECQVYRLGGPVGGGTLVPVGTVDGEHADVCVDDTGIVLEEVDVVEGDRVLRRRVAVELELAPELPPDVFEGADVEPAPPDQGGGSVLAVDPASRPPGETFFELPADPDGFRRRGRYAVIPPQAQEFADPTLRERRVAGVVDVWVAGPDFVAVDQGGTLGRLDPFDAHPHGRAVDAGALGEAELILGLRTSEVRVKRDGGRYVRVYGTVAPDVLVEVARALRPQPGGELVYLEDPG